MSGVAHEDLYRIVCLVVSDSLCRSSGLGRAPSDYRHSRLSGLGRALSEYRHSRLSGLGRAPSEYRRKGSEGFFL